MCVAHCQSLALLLTLEVNNMVNKTITGPYSYGGTRTDNYGNVAYGAPGSRLRKTITDNSWGSPPFPDKDGDHKKEVYYPLSVTGRDRRHNLTRYTFDDHVVAVRPYSVGQYPPISLQNWAALRTKALASFSPVKPVFDLSLVLFELRELPSLLRESGAYLLKQKSLWDDIGGSYLQYKFGWAPLISDLVTLINLGEEIDQRASQLENYAKKLRAKGSLGGTSSQVSWNQEVAQYGYAKFTGIPKFTIATTARYQAKFKDFDAGNLKDNGGLKKFRQAIGLKAPLSTIWNALPWSFLVDYFFNVSDFIVAASGLASYDLESICIMQDYQCNGETVIYPQYFEGEVTNITSTVTGWSRRCYLDARPALRFLPILSNTQKLNIAALLSSARARRSHYGGSG